MNYTKVRYGLNLYIYSKQTLPETKTKVTEYKTLEYEPATSEPEVCIRYTVYCIYNLYGKQRAGASSKPCGMFSFLHRAGNAIISGFCLVASVN
jgi:hypothetical protein